MHWNISEQHIQNGLLNTITNTGLLGRWQILKKHPLTICDTAHNEDGIRNVLQQLQETNYKQLHIVFGMVNDKNIEKYFIYYLNKLCIIFVKQVFQDP